MKQLVELISDFDCYMWPDTFNCAASLRVVSKVLADDVSVMDDHKGQLIEKQNKWKMCCVIRHKQFNTVHVFCITVRLEESDLQSEALKRFLLFPAAYVVNQFSAPAKTAINFRS